MRNKIYAVLALSLLSTTALASELTIVGDLGGESTDRYFEGINNQDAGSGASTLPPATHYSADDALQATFPISTPELSAGSVADRPLNAPGMQPLFLIGDDDASRTWLKVNSAKLAALNATGMVVNVNSLQDFKALSREVAGVTLLPVSGSDLARRLKLTHYPVLLTASGVTQDNLPENSAPAPRQ